MIKIIVLSNIIIDKRQKLVCTNMLNYYINFRFYIKLELYQNNSILHIILFFDKALHIYLRHRTSKTETQTSKHKNTIFKTEVQGSNTFLKCFLKCHENKLPIPKRKQISNKLYMLPKLKYVSR